MPDIVGKEFWEAVAANGPVPYDELNGRVADVLAENPDWAKLPDVETTVLYSGNIGDAKSTPVANDLASRGQGTIGIIDDTPAGKALGGMTESLSSGNLEARYSNYIDFSDAPMTSKQWSLDQASTDLKTKSAAWKFSGDLYAPFRSSSEAFSSQISGRVITITPEASAGRDFRNHEIPNVVKGLDEGRITHVNGVSREEILKGLGTLEGEARYNKAFESFNESFAENMKRLGNDVYIDADGKTTGMDIEQADLPEHGASQNARLDDFDPKGGVAQDIHGFRTATTRISAADDLGELRGFAATPDGSTSHLIDTKTSTIYTVTGDDLTGVQKFNNSQEAGQAFGRMMGEAAQAHPEAFKGLPKVHSSLGALGNHVDDLGRAPWRKALGAFGEGAAELGGKASKILGPLGVAAAGAEAYGLEMKLQDYEDFSLVPEDAMLAYRGILTAHMAQATVDPTLVGGEVAIQVAHDEWAQAYGIDDNVKEALEPGSLLEDAYDAKMWLDQKAEEAGMAVRDYAVSRWNDPGKLGEDWETIKDAAETAAVTTGQVIGYAAEVASDTAEAVGDYAVDRYNNPEKLLEDAEAVGEAINDGLEATGNSIYNGAKGAWNYLFGEEEPSRLEQSLKGDETSQAVLETVPFGDAAKQFADNREILRAMDPAEELTETQLANNPEAEAMFMRLHNLGMQQFPAEGLSGDTPQARIGNVLQQAHAIDREVTAEISQDVTSDTMVNFDNYYKPEETDYSAAG